MKFPSISQGELRLLNAFTHGRDDSCATDRQDWLEHHDSRMRLASLFGYIRTLERKGLIVYTRSEQAETGGRPRRMYRVTPRGHCLMQLAREMMKD